MTPSGIANLMNLVMVRRLTEGFYDTALNEANDA